MIHRWLPPPAKLTADDSVALWRINLTPSGQTLATIRPWLAADEVDRAGRFRFERDRLRYEIGRGALRHIIGRYIGLPPAKVPLTYSEHRKPLLAEPAALYFNLSNSHDVAVLAISQRGPIGVDVEYVGRPIDDILDLAATVFSPAEQQALAAAPVAERQQTFLRGWTRKEAYLKGIGKGLMVPLQNFTVSLEAVDRPTTSLPVWHLLDFDPGREYIGALATPFRAEAVDFFEWQR